MNSTFSNVRVVFREALESSVTLNRVERFGSIVRRYPNKLPENGSPFSKFFTEIELECRVGFEG
ncbi:MAG: hypothetical protein JNK90_05030 [Planctomycetaceae bacterium]|nr:hypothetical protein [Planctomycetaceae bacterium]